MEEKLVTVITITWNRGKLLGRCVSSVLSQTYNNIEHIVVDGASDDETDSVISIFKDERLRFVKLDYNWSYEDSIKYAAKLARGSYITFLDSDDEYVPTKIEKQVKLIESLPANYGMVYCWMTYFDSSKNNKVVRLHNPQLRGFVPLEAAEKPSVSGTPTFLFRKEVYDELGGWNWNCPIPTDFELGARCCQKWSVDYVPESLVNVYVNHCYERYTDVIHNKNSNEFKKRVAMHQYMLDEFKDIFDKHPAHKAYHLSRQVFFSYKNGLYKDAILYLIKYLLCKLNIK